MAFLPEINNKRDTIFCNIKIIKVIIPLRTILHGYRDSEEFVREQRVYRPNHENYLERVQFSGTPNFRLNSFRLEICFSRCFVK